MWYATERHPCSAPTSQTLTCEDGDDPDSDYQMHSRTGICLWKHVTTTELMLKAQRHTLSKKVPLIDKKEAAVSLPSMRQAPIFILGSTAATAAVSPGKITTVKARSLCCRDIASPAMATKQGLLTSRQKPRSCCKQEHMSKPRASRGRTWTAAGPQEHTQRPQVRVSTLCNHKAGVKGLMD